MRLALVVTRVARNRRRQVYAPVDRVATAFHRTVFLFVAPEAGHLKSCVTMAALADAYCAACRATSCTSPAQFARSAASCRVLTRFTHLSRQVCAVPALRVL
jgi:hypothetical protein